MTHLQVPKVRLKWGYVQTRKPYITKPLEIVVESPDVVRRLNEIVQQHVIPMSQLLRFKLEKGVDADEEFVQSVVQNVPPTSSHCEMYGGCPYKAHCKDVGPTERIKSLMGNQPASGSSGVSSLLARMKSRSKDNPPAKIEEATPPAPAKAVAAAINPPEEEQAPERTEVPAEAPAKRTRAKKAPKAEDVVEAIAGGMAAAIASAEAPRNKGITLYVNCIPLSGDACENTNRLLSQARQIVNDQLQVVDYRLKAFGEGTAYFVQTAAALAKDGSVGSEFVLDTRTPEGAVLLAPFLELAGKNVVRGMS